MSALIVVPPLLKYGAGPLAGPAMLAGVGRMHGHHVRVLDLNNSWLRRFSLAGYRRQGPLGDHVRPVFGFRAAEAAWRSVCRLALGGLRGASNTDPWMHLCADFETVDRAARRLAGSPLGCLWASQLPRARPRVFGVSVMWSGQVLGALAISILARRRWPDLPIVWGGAHVAALAPEIAGDARYGRFVDGFVAGYAESTFAQLLEGAWPSEVFSAGCGEPQRAVALADVVPAFQDLGDYGNPVLALPVQTTRGCSYGACLFCTYPAIEGPHRTLGLGPLQQVVEVAELHDAHLAVKDALAPKKRMLQIADVIDGRARWAACTRLTPRIGRADLQRLVRSGLGTLELGVESLDPATLKAMQKRQPLRLLHGLLEDATGLDLDLVLNMMIGFPGQAREDAEETLRTLRVELPRRYPGTRFSVELNLLELERRAPLTTRAAEFGIEVTGSWPWSSVLAWNAPDWRTDFSRRRL